MVRESKETLGAAPLDEVTLAKLRLRAVSERHSTVGGVTRLLLPDARSSGNGRSLLKIAGVAAAALIAGVVLARFPEARRAAGVAITEQLVIFGQRRK